MKLLKLTGLALAALAMGGAATAKEDLNPFHITQGTVIRNATVVNTRNGSLQRDAAIVIRDGKILRVVPNQFIRTSGSTQVVDIAGKYVVPGFLDMHTHAMDGASQQPTFWPLLLANGVTGVREMRGSAALIEQARQLNIDSAAGRVDAPEILTIPGEIIGGLPAASYAAPVIQQQKAYGANFIKVVNADRDSSFALLAEAKAQGLEISGHLPTSLTAIEASNAGWHALEHLGGGMGVILDCADDQAAIRAALASGAGPRPPFPPTFTITPLLYTYASAPLFQRILDTYNEDKCKDLSKVFVKNETWHVPTLIRLKTQIMSDTAQYRTDPNLIYIDKATRALWEQLGQAYATTVPATNAATFRQYYGLEQKVTRLMKRQNVKMLAGSDLGGIWVIPGFSLHQEFKELSVSGFSPLEVLQMTTLNGAEFLHRESTMGTVESGKNADLVVLDANPLTNVANLDKIAAVFSKGKYFSKDALEKLKNDVATAYENEPAKSVSPALTSGHID